MSTLLVCLIGCRAPPQAESMFEFSRRAMGVEARILLQAPSIESASAAAEIAFAEIEQLDACFSDWNANSELSRLSDAAGTGPVAVSHDLFDVLQRAREISAATDGALDVTVGPLVVLWREARRTRTLPAAAQIEEARTRVGWQLLELDASRSTVALTRPGMRLDLGGIGKGYACQRALDVLAHTGFERALVQMGGDIVCGAPPMGRDGWTVDVAGESRVVHDCAIATSGDTEQHVMIDGVRYSHVVDARTGLGLTTRTVLTVRARDGAYADALATALGALEDADVGWLVQEFDAELLLREIE